jgi:hypothetical protein
MIRRREFIALPSGAAWPLAARAQRRTLPVIGILGSATAEPNASEVSAFMQGLKDIGFVEGQDMGIEAHWANDQYDRLPAMAAELVRARVALIFAVVNNFAEPCCQERNLNNSHCILDGGRPSAAGYSRWAESAGWKYYRCR